MYVEGLNLLWTLCDDDSGGQAAGALLHRFDFIGKPVAAVTQSIQRLHSER